MQDASKKSLSRVWIIAAVLLLFIVGFFIYLNHARSMMAVINIHVIPKDANIYIDGSAAKVGVARVQPGTHVIIASKTGFKDDKRTISVSKKQKIDLYLLPAPQSSAAKQSIDSDPTQQALSEKYAGYNAGYVQEQLKKNYPILADLPYITANVGINYGVSVKHPDDPTKIALYITATPDDRQIALDWIKGEGFNPASFEIVYKNP